ncbi:MAG: amino acid-binding protein [Arcobacter sp.]|nr:MAG: amino acid-binding protein [Arcobacter sp.]
MIILFFTVFNKIYFNDTIILGASVPKSGIMKEWGKSVEVGSNAYFKYVNEKNILSNDRKIKLITLDDKYEPDLTFENTKKLLERKDLFALYGFVGTPTVKNILPLLEDNELPFIAPFSGASFLRNTENKNFINFRSSYKEEIEDLVNYLHLKRNISKFAVFYQNDDYGEEGYVSLIKALEKKKLQLQGEGTYKRNTLSIKHAFTEIRNSEPEAVIMVGSYNANALFIKRAKKDEKLKDTIFCNISFSDANEMIKNLDFKTENLLFSEVVPSYNDSKIDVIKEYKYLMRRYYPEEPLGFISLESFLSAKIVVKALQNTKGFLTHAKFIEQLKILPKNTLKGIEIKYKNTQLLNKVYLFKYVNSKFTEIEYEKK